MASTQNKTQGIDNSKLVESTEKPKIKRKVVKKSKTGAFNMRTETEVEEQKEKMKEVMKPTLPKKEIIDEKKEIIDEKKDFNMNTKEIVEEEISDAETEIFENDEEIYNEIVEEKKVIVEEKKEIVEEKKEIVVNTKSRTLQGGQFEDEEHYYRELQKMKEECEIDMAKSAQDVKNLIAEMERIKPERKITKSKKVKITKPKKAKFDVNAISVDDELDTIIEDHHPPIRAVVCGDIRTAYNDCKEIKFSTLTDAHEYYKNTLKPMIDITDNKYCGIVKMNLGYMLKPIHEKGIQKWTASKHIKEPRWRTFITWEFDESCLE